MQYEIFRAGTRKDANGNIVTITAQDLHNTAQSYNAQFHEAPLVLGHPQHNTPAYGWVSKLSVNGDVLTADFKQVDDNLVDWVRQGRYKKVSASFYPPSHPSNPVKDTWYLRHVGFLGASAPAVKGLAEINFADDETGCVEFSEEWVFAQHTLARMMRRLREWIISKHGVDEADNVITEWQIQDLQTPPTPEPTPNFNEPKPEKDDPMTEVEKQAIARAEKAEAELAKLQAEQEQALRKAAHQQNADFAEELVKSGSLKPADKGLVVQVLDFAEYPEHTTADFSENGKTTSLANALRNYFKAQTPILSTGETATADRAGKTPNVSSSHDFAEYAEPNALSHHERALSLAAKENISYEEAARRTVQ